MRKMRCLPLAVWLVALCVSAAVSQPAGAEVRLPKLFSDHMVVQRDREVPVWGWAEPKESVSVTLAGQTVSAVADADGRWTARVSALPAGGPHTLVVKGSSTVTVSDVLVGEVWLCSGQSNMNMPIDWGIFGAWGSPECEKALAEVDVPQVRMFLVENNPAGAPAADVGGVWKLCQHREILKWSAVGYFFGRELHRELNVPIGLVKSAVGGTPIESWTDRATLIEVVPQLKAAAERWDRRVAEFDQAKYEKELKAWDEAAAKAKAEGKPQPRGKPTDPATSTARPSCLYNGMIAPLVPYAMRGVIWYQGESNNRQAYQYRALFPAMIRSWRAQWKQGDFPFLFVQLANYMKREAEPTESAWAELREAQLMALSLPNTAMAVIIDIGEADDIHPKNKLDVGRRLALGALRLAYGKDVVHSGPIYDGMKIEGGAVRLSFKHTGGGLVAAGGEVLRGFAIAGEDRKFVWAEARIEGAAVVVRSDKVAKPVAVRYAWGNNPECNLYNREGLPASPFRTDQWPGLTAPKQ